MIYSNYKAFADYVAALLGPHTEVVLHDFSDLDHSIVYIVNNHITNRVIGDTATDLLLEFLTKQSKVHEDFLTNYSSKSRDGITLHSSTFFIKDKTNAIIGALCTNTDFTTYKNAMNQINQFIPNASIFEDGLDHDSPEEIKETFYESPETMTLHKIKLELDKVNIPPERMTSEEKQTIVENLYKMGIFILKGSVQKTALQLKTSDASIYRYIKTAKENNPN